MSLEIATLAETIAIEAHRGQMYGESNRDMIEAHVRPVAETIRQLGYGPTCEAVGWLHDVVEDTDMTLDDLREAGMPEEVVRPVGLLTRRKEEDRQRNLEQIAEDPRAVVAKFVDSSKNFANCVLNVDRLQLKVVRKRIIRYAGNIAFLQPRLLPPDADELKEPDYALVA
jgi:(p)ppGpp synthase/HD superfamily hydrolase